MTAVNISGTFAKDERPMNGLEGIAQQLVDDEFGTHLVVGRIKPHGYSKKPGEPLTPVVKFEREAGPATPLSTPAQMDGQIAIDDGPALVDVGVILLRYSEAAGWVVGPPGGAGFSTAGVDIAEDDVEAARLWAGGETLAVHGVEVIRWAESTDQAGAWVAVLADDGGEDDGPVSSKTPDVWLDDK